MDVESRWYAAVSENDGRPPEVRHFTEADLADPTLPTRLALAVVEGRAGYRPTAADDGTPIWYWPRPGGEWWSVPRSLNLAAHAVLQEAIRESCRRNGGVSRRGDVISMLRARLMLA